MQPVIEMDIAYYLLIPESRANLPAVVAFRTWIEAEAADFRSNFEKRSSCQQDQKQCCRRDAL